MTGNGTQIDPFVVTTVNEIRETCATNDVYIKLGKDIDMKSKSAWETLEFNCSEFDLDGHTIKNIYLSSNCIAFNNVRQDRKAYIKNGKILDIRDSSAASFAKSPTGSGTNKMYLVFENVSFSFYTTGYTSYIFDGAGFELCNTYIKNENTTDKPWFNFHVKLSNEADVNDSRFYVDGSVGSRGLVATSGYSNTEHLVCRSCLWDGRITGNAGFFSGTKRAMADSFFNLDVQGLMVTGQLFSNSSDRFTILNGEKAGGHEFPNNFVSSTEAQILNPSYNITYGFDIIEVTE